MEFSTAGASCVEEGCDWASTMSFPRAPAVELADLYRALNHAKEAGLYPVHGGELTKVF